MWRAEDIAVHVLSVLQKTLETVRAHVYNHIASRDVWGHAPHPPKYFGITCSEITSEPFLDL